MRILLASTSSGSRESTELYLLHLGRALVKRGHHVTLWTSTHARMDGLCLAFVPVGHVLRGPYQNTYDCRTRSLASLIDLGGAARIAKQWQGARPDIVHVNKQNFEDGLDLLRAAEATNLPNVCSIQFTQTAREHRFAFAWLRDRVSRKALNAYDGPLVCVHDEAERNLRRFIGEQPRIQTIPNAAELYDLSQRELIRRSKREELGYGPGTLLLLATGQFTQHNRPFAFLDLAERIHARLPEARFLWVGEGPLAEDWDDCIAERNLRQVVRRVGWPTHVADFLFAADALLHIAESDSLQYTILEALSAGLPCVLPPHQLAEMPFLDASNSIAITENDNWTAPLADPAQLATLGKNARRLAETRLSFDSMAERYEALYKEQRR